MSTVADFNYKECEKVDPNCIDAYLDYTWDPENPTVLCVESSWGGGCLDLSGLVKASESCTSLYLSPEENPNCLVYEKEEQCGDNDCINGDDLSRIISLRYLKDVEQTAPTDGDTYIYNGETGLFEPYPLVETITNLQTAIQNINAAITNLQNRVSNIEQRIAPPEGCPDSARIAYASINLYSDYNASVNSSGTATSLDKTHGIFGHSLLIDESYDELMG